MLDETQPRVEGEEQVEPPSDPSSESPPSGAVEVIDGDQPVASTEESVEQKVEAKPKRAPRGKKAPASGRASRGKQAVEKAPEEAPADQPAVPSPRLQQIYRDEIVPALMGEFGYPNPMRAPRIQKIVLNIGLGEALTNSRAMDGATRDLAIISGQKPIITRARKSIAAFKIREGNPIGTSVTLRGARMYHFLDRLINMALPRIRDFRGIQRMGFDGRGNFSIGIREQIIFPEIDYNQIDRIRGLQVTIATSATNDAEAIRLLELYGMPFVRQA